MIDNPNKFDIIKLDLIAKTAVEGFLTGLPLVLFTVFQLNLLNTAHKLQVMISRILIETFARTESYT